MDGEVSLYRKWRPQNFGEVVGQSHIVQTLKNMVKSGRINHAYLFTGPRGTGKTSVARILAKAVNCTQYEDGEPCGECTFCSSIAKGISLDILEIDAASNRGIEEIKDLRGKVHFTPAQLKYKVYIIDEVHMLTTEAFNALLKTLEEPPTFVIFVLATTEPHKVPLTIASRCLRFDFRNLREEDMVGLLQRISAKEDFSISDKALFMLVEAAQGSLRDALTYLEQVESFAGKEMKDDDVYVVLGIPSPSWVKRYLLSIILKRRREALEAVEELVALGRDLRQSIRQVIVKLRNIVISKLGDGYLDDDAGDILQLTNSISLDELTLLLDRLVLLEGDLRSSIEPRLKLEVFTLKESSLPSQVTERPVNEVSAPSADRIPPLEIEEKVSLETLFLEEGKEFTLTGFLRYVREVKRAIRLAAMLDVVSEVKIFNNEIILIFNEKHKPQMEFLKQSQQKEEIENLLSDYLKKKILLKFHLIEENVEKPDLTKNPMVQEALKLFEGSNIEIRKKK